MSMRKEDVIKEMAESKLIERYTSNFSENRELLRELSQEVYLTLLEYPEETILEGYRDGWINRFAFTIAKNMIFSSSSRFYYKYLRYEYNKRGLDTYINIVPDGEIDNMIPTSLQMFYVSEV